MKKILLAQCLATAALLTSCNLDLEPLDKLADQNYYNNRKELEVFTNGFYADFPTAEKTARGAATRLLAKSTKALQGSSEPTSILIR